MQPKSSLHSENQVQAAFSSNPHALRQQILIIRLLQKPLQHGGQRGIFLPRVPQPDEIIRHDARLLLHIELRQIAAVRQQMSVAVGRAFDVTALQCEADAATQHGIAQAVLPNVRAFVQPQILPMCRLL